MCAFAKADNRSLISLFRSIFSVRVGTVAETSRSLARSSSVARSFKSSCIIMGTLRTKRDTCMLSRLRVSAVDHASSWRGLRPDDDQVNIYLIHSKTNNADADTDGYADATKSPWCVT